MMIIGKGMRMKIINLGMMRVLCRETLIPYRLCWGKNVFLEGAVGEVVANLMSI